jgi:hypothetical protein
VIVAIERGDVYIHFAEEMVNIGSNLCRILAASSLLYGLSPRTTKYGRKGDMEGRGHFR